MSTPSASSSVYDEQNFWCDEKMQKHTVRDMRSLEFPDQKKATGRGRRKSLAFTLELSSINDEELVLAWWGGNEKEEEHHDRSNCHLLI